MRNEVPLTDDQLCAMFDDAFCVGVAPSNLNFSRATFADFRDAAKSYAECGAIREREFEGVASLEAQRVQVKKGDVRKSVYVFDFGSVRVDCAL